LEDGILRSMCHCGVKGGALLASDCAANDIAAFSSFSNLKLYNT
jgi:hypothetical protein